MDLRNATIAPAPETGAIGRKAAQMIREEVEKRTQLRLPVGAGGSPEIVLRRRSGPPDGFVVRTNGTEVAIEGNHERGVIFGAGYFLRQAVMDRGRLEIADDLVLLC
jgi:hypothetical protein